MPHEMLIEFLRQPTPEAFHALLEESREAVLNTAYRVVGEVHLAEDVTQEVFMKVLEKQWNLFFDSEIIHVIAFKEHPQDAIWLELPDILAHIGQREKRTIG